MVDSDPRLASETVERPYNGRASEVFLPPAPPRRLKSEIVVAEITFLGGRPVQVDFLSNGVTVYLSPEVGS